MPDTGAELGTGAQLLGRVTRLDVPFKGGPTRVRPAAGVTMKTLLTDS
jgi:hypothetical protein